MVTSLAPLKHSRAVRPISGFAAALARDNPNRQVGAMKELLRSNDPVYLSYVRHVLAEAGIEFLQLDDHMAALEGSVGAIPRRIMVLEEDLGAARLSLGKATLNER